MQSYRDSLGTAGDLLVLSPDGEYFKYFKQAQAGPPARR